MRILHILDHSLPLHSGYTFRTLSILKAQRAMGWETFHVTGEKQASGEQLEETVDDWKFFRTPKDGSYLNRFPVLNQVAVINSLARRLFTIVPQVKPDILHAHSPSLNAVAALRVARKLRIPLVYEVRAFWEDAAVDHGTSTEWGIRYRLTRALESHALHHADAITTICEGLRGDIIARQIAPGKVTVIPNAVDLENFTMIQTTDDELRNGLGLRNRQVIGFIGSFYAYEGLTVLLQALPLMLADNADLRLLLVGGGPQEAELRQLANELRIADKVIFTGRVPHEQVQRYYSIIDVLVYPRLSMRLTDLVTPLKPLEAMAQGKLLAASDVGGHRELIRDGHNGVLFKTSDPHSLAEKVSALLRAPARWPALRQAGREYVETERNWVRSVAGYRPVYQELLGQQ
ncbi:TIGR04063 family PEP-CTERM/XrtA system glycosyltransferase [Nitrosomonas mobilis]|uniref:Glycosyl transferase, group 1 n=1 Tax=Nitrosomonas mobilis TaxID=51642 RepID=A0A1G5SGI6_9PROT|nr:TIGR04063 family PEP-CTERM/XrtA system glycosyltransferase [Nitrosomonas mobilis]SCZ86313.1 Glycosyl transferase, group 1 [Nitrosomonas mobilis]HNO74016.1 glycosyltransferase, exosortase A system-associated [Nitrosomonas mobilis]